MSQFWYSDETAERLAEELAHEAGKGGRCVVAQLFMLSDILYPGIFVCCILLAMACSVIYRE